MPESSLAIIFQSIPKWLLSICAVLFISAIIISGITGEPFIFAGDLYGWNRAPHSGLVTRKPNNELEWQQRKYVADLALRLSMDTKPYTDVIYRKFPGLATGGKTISQTEAEKLFSENDVETIWALKGILNHLEGMIVSLKNGVADEKLFMQSFKRTIVKWNSSLAEFKKEAKQKCGCEWAPLDQAIEELNTEQND